MRTDRSRLWAGSALAAGSAVIFGLGTTFGRIAYDGGSNPLTVAALRVGCFVLLVGALQLGRGRLGIDRPALRASLWMGACLVVVGLGYLASVAFLPVGLSALIYYTYPLLVGLIAAAAGRERLGWGRLAALLVAFGGLALALGAELSGLDWRGLACVGAAAVATAILNAFVGSALRGRDPLVINLYVNLWIVLVLLALLAGWGEVALPRTALGIAGLAGVCLSYVGAYVTWFFAARLIGGVQLAGIFNIEPLVSIVAAWLLLGEHLAGRQIAGGLLVLGAVAAVTLASLRRRAPA
ncbi:MAG: DMT family transporter [Dongiaceae bacterium]